MGRTPRSQPAVRPVDGTLKWVVVQYRLLCTLWVLVLVVVQWIDTEGHNPDRRVLAAGGVLAVFWTGGVLPYGISTSAPFAAPERSMLSASLA